jgi:hypothetical protein
MSTHKTAPNDPAFPEVQELPQFNRHTYGLTKREYFAAMAMQGLLACPNNVNMAQDIAKGAVIMADQLIIELNKTN